MLEKDYILNKCCSFKLSIHGLFMENGLQVNVKSGFTPFIFLKQHFGTFPLRSPYRLEAELSISILKRILCTHSVNHKRHENICRMSFYHLTLNILEIHCK